MAGNIFISYRREDGKAEARSIYQHLSQAFGSRQLFMDVDTIEKGRDFRKVLDDTLARCDVMLAIVGPNWLGARDGTGTRRLEHADDFVHQEIAVALKRNIPVIPVLVDGAQMPRGSDLPDALKGLAQRQAAIVTHENFNSDMKGLERDICALLGGSRMPWPTIAAAALVLAIALAGFGYFMWPAKQDATAGKPDGKQAVDAKTGKAAKLQKPAVPAVNDCDRLAAAPYDSEAVTRGVPLNELAGLAKRALAACEEAVKSSPNGQRFLFQLARAYDASGQFDEARKRYEVLAKQGYAAAMTSLAFMYVSHRGVQPDLQERLHWLKRAVELGNADAMFELGRSYQSEGLGIFPADQVQARRLLEQAVAGGHTTALVLLANQQDHGHGGFKPDPAAASQVMLKAIEAGDELARLNFATWGLTAFTEAFRREMQQRLKEAGVYDGPIDGIFGPPSIRAAQALWGRNKR